ncbi:MAG: L,D-transpeptidase family protein [Gammaproteobacteria bacterium]|nr:L,D-transpeptidase family protein [Gammaproteobacteria bacterium]
MAETSVAGHKLPAYILQLPESVISVFIAATETATLHRYERQGGGLLRREDRYMSVGENGVGKQRAWDRRTPLGIYFANDQLDTSRMHEKYGVTAFPLDYPNAWDEFNERTGDGIWIHGMARGGGRRPPLDTDGCIALPNDELLELENYLQLLTTPVIITRRITWLSPTEVKAARDEFSAALDTWVRSFRDGDWHRYHLNRPL